MLRAYPCRSERRWKSIDFPSFSEKVAATGIGSKRKPAEDLRAVAPDCQLRALQVSQESFRKLPSGFL
jgi:hypothetical protein